MAEPWNRCDECGQFIPYEHFASGDAKRVLVYPDSDLSRETYETLCEKCVKKDLDNG